VEEERKKTKQVMQRQSHITSYGQTKVQPVPEEKTFKTPLLPFYCWPWCYMAWKISLVSSGHLPGCVPSLPIVYPQSIQWRGRVRNREGLGAVQALFSSSYKISVLPLLLWSQI